MELTWAGGLLVVAPLAGWIIGLTSWRVPLLGLAVLSLGATVLSRRSLEPTAHDAPREARRGRFGPEAMLLLTASGIFFVAQELTFVAFGVWLEADFGSSVTAIGGFAAAVGAAELVGSAAVLLLGDRFGKLPSAVAGLVVSAVGFALLPTAGSIALAVILMSIALLGFEIAIVAVIPVASEVWPRSRSRFVAIFYSVVSVGRAVGAGVGPALFTATGIGVNVAVSASGQLVAAALLVWLLRREGTSGPSS